MDDHSISFAIRCIVQLWRGILQGVQSIENSFERPLTHPIYTAYLPPPRALVQVMAYADDITYTRVQPRNTYNHTYIKLLPGQNNNLTLHPDKTNCTLFTPDPADYKCNLDLKTNKGAGSYLRPKTYIHHMHTNLYK